MHIDMYKITEIDQTSVKRYIGKNMNIYEKHIGGLQVCVKCISQMHFVHYTKVNEIKNEHPFWKKVYFILIIIIYI